MTKESIKFWPSNKIHQRFWRTWNFTDRRFRRRKVSLRKDIRFAHLSLQHGSKTAWWLWLESELWPTYRCNDIWFIINTFLVRNVSSLQTLEQMGGATWEPAFPPRLLCCVIPPFSCPTNIQYLNNLWVLLKYRRFLRLPRLNSCAGLCTISLCCHSTNSWRYLGLKSSVLFTNMFSCLQYSLSIFQTISLPN